MVKYLTLFFVNLVFVSSVFADVTVGLGSEKAKSHVQTVVDGESITVYLDKDRSYACNFTTSGSASILEMDTTVRNGIIPAIVEGTAVNRNSATPGIALTSQHYRMCFIAKNSNLHLFKFINVDPGSGPSVEIVSNCVETSLYGGYNTNANPYNFLEISNTTDSTISGKIYAVNFDGSVVINNQAFSVGAGLRFDVDLHTPAGANKYGTLRVTHDGPFGALQAGVSQYTSTLEQRAHIPLKVRDQIK